MICYKERNLSFCLKRFFYLIENNFKVNIWAGSVLVKKREVWKTIDINIKFPNIRFFNTCLYFASIGHLIVPTFDTKVTDYLCLMWVFFLHTSFDFLTSHFWRNFKISFERYYWFKFKFENIFHLWSFFIKLWGLKQCHSCQFGTINARFISRY